MAEGLVSSEEISRHQVHSKQHDLDHDVSDSDDEGRDHDRTLSIIEAFMLAIVALLAAYTGLASAKWNTESSVRLAQASAARIEANRAAQNADSLKNFDSTTFNTESLSIVVDENSRSGGDGPGAAVGLGRRHAPLL